MPTIIRQYAAPASFPDTIILDLEPPIDWGGVVPDGHFRLAKTLNFALNNRIAAGLDAQLSNGGSYEVDSQSVSVATGTALYVPAAANLPLSFMSVFRQTAGGVNQTLMGNANTSGGDSAGIGVSSGGNLVALARAGSTNYAASLPKDGGDRWEMVVGTFDNRPGAGASILRLYRPRTGSMAEVTNATLPASIATHRILGASAGTLNQSVRGALSAYWFDRVLAQATIQNMYASVKASLATSGIDI
ncbi:hypothetical protein A7X93_00700 [Stenotrophomonas maltophilia]|jgi:hypothetical protein|uniref:hypothetical protein n=1 Tax=Stenotrophomonas TaxID=40323 RepID=UPI0007F033E2|nr:MULTISPECIES: hypothetical protein [Stenotrophomonas]MDH2022489.1 hypothetical protein [Stenotrophomonas sp. GD03680]OBU48540.1 hypothetical protein A9K76_15850 [Stenotrophomonas maltophilia]PZT35157.1 hypothetical protein A7X93_00700 [Stenotrophomonas maltophilia]HEL3748612.1 hypothetical protein [Stenotrophomonas maltophilia]HEL7729638.1 hypothetical protein [Stenotrophomonas maltophilia]